MSLVILHLTSEYRGDHTADVTIAIEPVVGETVAGLAHRLKLRDEDWIEIRLTRSEIPEI